MTKILLRALAAVVIAGGVGAPAIARADHRGDERPSIVDTVINVSGAAGFDRNGWDYDLLREALVAADLVGAVEAADDITVFAPNDHAFIRLARDLGYDGRDEAGAFGYIAAATGFESAAEPGLLDDVLLYHVAPGARGFLGLQRGEIPTLLDGASLDVNLFRVVDNDPNDRDASLTLPFNLRTSDGIIHTVSRVLRPVDLPPLVEPAPEPEPGILDTVLAVSGSDGFDTDKNDYDILREALEASGLDAAIAAAEDITVFAPRDQAFIRLARSLGYDGRDEAGAFGYIAGATGFVSAADPGLLDDVLLYHVAPGRIFSGDLADGPVTTLLDGATFVADGIELIDGDPNAKNARVRAPFDLEVADGVIHTVNRVLRPIDLPPVAPATVVDAVIDASGAEGFDDDKYDFDILREALVAADLAGTVAGLDDVTVFAPRDQAFIRLARDLGYDGTDEAGVFGFIAEATGFVSAENPGLLDDVLLYHVAPGAQTVRGLQGEVATLLEGASVTVDGRSVEDADLDDRDARIRHPRNLVTGNGIIQTINRVLRPIDLP